jgi:hypothetical protein
VVAAARHATSTLTLSKFQLSLASHSLSLSLSPPLSLSHSLSLFLSPPLWPGVSNLPSFVVSLARCILGRLPDATTPRNAPHERETFLTVLQGMAPGAKGKTAGEVGTLCIIRQEISRDRGNRSSGACFSYRARSPGRSRLN